MHSLTKFVYSSYYWYLIYYKLFCLYFGENLTKNLHNQTKNCSFAAQKWLRYECTRNKTALRLGRKQQGAV